MRWIVPLLCSFALWACTDAPKDLFAGGPVQVDPEQALHAAVLLGSCLPDDGVNRTLSDIYSQVDAPESQPYAPRNQVACLAGKSSGCAAVRECFTAEVTVTSTCTPSCNGSVLEECDGPLRAHVDCAALGLVCSSELKSCVPATRRPACDFETYEGRCEDGRPTYCSEHGEEVGVDCEAFGLSCSTSLHGERLTGCLGRGAACQAFAFGGGGFGLSDGMRCASATELEICIAGGAHRIDCGSLAPGFRCQSVETGAGPRSFCGLDSACDPLQPARCEGTTLSACNAGRLVRVDCQAYGFTGCSARWGVCSPSPWP